MRTPFGLFKFNRMHFSFTNSPDTCQRLIGTCKSDLNLKTCLTYLDDIIVFRRTFEEMLERLEEVLKRLATFGLKLQPSKWDFFKEKISNLRTHALQLDERSSLVPAFDRNMQI